MYSNNLLLSLSDENQGNLNMILRVLSFSRQKED